MEIWEKSLGAITIVDNNMVNTELTGTQEKTFTLDIDILGSFQRKYYLIYQLNLMWWLTPISPGCEK